MIRSRKLTGKEVVIVLLDRRVPALGLDGRIPESARRVALDKCEDASQGVDDEDSPNDEIQQGSAPDRVARHEAKYEDRDRGLAGCKQEDGPRLRDPTPFDCLHRLLGAQIEYMPGSSDAGHVCHETCCDDEKNLSRCHMIN